MALSPVTDPAILARLNAALPAPAARPTATVIPTRVNPNEAPPAKIETAVGTEVGTAPIPTQQIYQDLAAQRSQVNTIAKQVDRVQNLYSTYLKGQEPWRVAREYFPGLSPTSDVSKGVERFRTAGAQLFSFVTPITRTVGEGSVDQREFAQKLLAFRPSSDDTDATIEEKIRGMRDLIQERQSFLTQRMREVRPQPSTAMKAARAAIRPTVRIDYDAKGNRIP